MRPKAHELRIAGQHADTQGKNLSSPKKSRVSGIFENPSPLILEITITANRIAANKPGINPYRLRNALLVEEEKARICAENAVARVRKPRRAPGPYARYDAKGLTRADKIYTDKELQVDAEREGANHRRTLDRNLGKAGYVRINNVCAHHIVASGHPDAYGSRRRLFKWGIGINDADNGVFLPGTRGIVVPTMEKAVQHDDLHADEGYYLLVDRRLSFADQSDQASGRKALRDMRDEMIGGTFPVARD